MQYVVNLLKIIDSVRKFVGVIVVENVDCFIALLKTLIQLLTFRKAMFEVIRGYNYELKLTLIKTTEALDSLD